MELTSILDYLFIGYGAFFIYEWFLVQIKGRPFSAGIILPQDLTQGTCRNPEGLGRFIAPRLLMEGALLAGFGGFSLLNRRLALLSFWPFFILSIAFSVTMIALYVATVKKARRFWADSGEER